MVHRLVEGPGERSPSELHEAYLASLRAIVDAAGTDAVAKDSGVDAERLARLADGVQVELSFEEATGILAAEEGAPADAIAAEARDHLLMGMTTAVLDVDAVAANVEGMGATGIQQRIEGRTGMTLAEFAALQAFIDGKQG